MIEISCRDPRIGAQITRYELGALGEEEGEAFERHVLECSFCRQELEIMLPVAGVLRANRHLLASELTERGLSFVNQRDHLLERVRRGRRAAEMPSRIGQWLGALVQVWRKPYVFVPAVVAVAASLLLVVRLSRQPESPFSSILDYAPLAAADTQVRGVQTSTASTLFADGMVAYSKGDYGTAISNLRKATRSDPSMGPGWLYLGVAYYLKREPKSAIEALGQAVARTNGGARDYSRFYLAESYLLDNQPEPALAIINELDHDGGTVSVIADSLASRVHALQKH